MTSAVGKKSMALELLHVEAYREGALDCRVKDLQSNKCGWYTKRQWKI